MCADKKPNRYMVLMLAVAGLGGLLYGIDVGIIAGALPYLEATFKDAVTGQSLSAGQLSSIVAAVLLGSVLSTLFAGLLADWLGRKRLMTLVGISLVDRKGRKFLLSLGSAGVIASLIAVGVLFRATESQQVDCRAAVQALVAEDPAKGPRLALAFDPAQADRLLATAGEAGRAHIGKPVTLSVIYACGDYVGASKVLRSVDKLASIEITRASCLPSGVVDAFFKNPFADLARAKAAPLTIVNALITPIPGTQHGWLIALCIFAGVAFFAIGPGVCVWLALSELMPTRIRSNGMSIALLINQAVSTTIAAVFLPTVGKYGYGTMFFAFAACTVVYFVTAFFFLPETKGKTLEEIAAHFDRKRSGRAPG